MRVITVWAWLVCTLVRNQGWSRRYAVERTTASDATTPIPREVFDVLVAGWAVIIVAECGGAEEETAQVDIRAIPAPEAEAA